MLSFYACDKEEDNNAGDISVTGCTNLEALNYNPNATIDDGSCIILGCTDENAINYNPSATSDDGSCVYDNTSIDESSLLEINLYPNPNNGSFNINLNTDLNNLKISIFNILGQEVFTENITNYIGTSKKTIDLDLVKGTYIVNIETENKTTKIPMIIE